MFVNAGFYNKELRKNKNIQHINIHSLDWVLEHRKIHEIVSGYNPGNGWSLNGYALVPKDALMATSLQNAGGLYYFLRKALGFGELTMSYKADAVTFKWTFHAGNTPFYSTGAFSIFDLLHMQNVELEAINLAETFKIMHGGFDD